MYIEQQIPRPKDKRRRKMYYSGGKKKKHTVKNQLTVNNQDYIIHKLGHKKGRRHDYNIYKKNHPVMPKDVVNVYDLRYLGVEKDFPEQILSLPYKKKRNQRVATRRNRLQQNPFQEENSNRTYHHLSIKKIQNTERYFQK